MAQHVGIHNYKELIFIEAYAVTTVGVWMATESIVTIPRQTPDAELGSMVRRVLEQSGSIVPHPTDFSKMERPLLKLAGVKNWSTFDKNSAYCSITVENEQCEIVPYRKYGKQGGVVGIVEAKRTFQNLTNEELGRAVQDALKIAAETEPKY